MLVLPSWMVDRDESDRYLARLQRKEEDEDRWKESSLYKFFEKANERFPQVYERYRHFDAKAIVDYESLCPRLIEDQSEMGQIVIVRLIYVVQSERGHGVALQLLRNLTQVSQETGCCILGVCSPFSRLGEPDVSETIKDVARDFAKYDFSISEMICEHEYRGPQKRMGKRFSEAGFEQIDVSEFMAKKSKHTPEDTWIYLPKSCDQGFREAIGHRLVKCE